MDAIQKIKKALAAGPTEGPWMLANRDDEHAPASVFAMPREGHAYAVFMCPRYGREEFQVNAEYALSVQPANMRAILQLIADRDAEVERLRYALRKVNAWALPAAVDRDGKPSSFELEHGSNGAREYIRGIAAAALNPTQGEKS